MPAPERLTLQELEAALRHLAAIHRPSASAGEREGQEWLAGRLRAEGAAVEVDVERAHGTYWWPLGVLCALAGAGSLSGRRAAAVGAGAFAAAGIADDISGGAQWFRRRFLRSHETTNVVAECGDRDAPDTVVVIAHMDAAHWSLLFHPGVSRWVGTRFPDLLERTNTTPPLMFPVFGGPLLIAVGALLGHRGRLLQGTGTFLALATAATMVEIGSRSTVPGANDNLSGVVTLLGVARALHAEPIAGLCVILLCTGSEESFMEGMQAYARRHFAQLDPARTHVVCLDTVGSPELLLLEGEGMLWMRDYPAAFKALVAQCAQDAGVALRRGLRFRNATDGLIALKAGFPSVMIGSYNEFKVPDNYHWPTDDADHVTYPTIGGAVTLVEAVVRRLAGQSSERASATASASEATSPA